VCGVIPPQHGPYPLELNPIMQHGTSALGQQKMAFMTSEHKNGSFCDARNRGLVTKHWGRSSIPVTGTRANARARKSLEAAPSLSYATEILFPPKGRVTGIWRRMFETLKRSACTRGRTFPLTARAAPMGQGITERKRLPHGGEAGRGLTWRETGLSAVQSHTGGGDAGALQLAQPGVAQ